MNAKFWLRHPHLIPARIKYWMWEQMHPDFPWFCPGAVHFLDRSILPGAIALEYGSGRSTIWLASRVSHLTSVEHDSTWFKSIASRISRNGITNVVYRYTPIEGANETKGPIGCVTANLPRYVSVADDFADGTLDLVIVDGQFRLECIRHTIPKIRPGGLLLLDDSQRWPDLANIPVPANWPIVNHSTNGLKHTSIWRRPA